jgi:hypothetical protein
MDRLTLTGFRKYLDRLPYNEVSNLNPSDLESLRRLIINKSNFNLLTDKIKKLFNQYVNNRKKFELEEKEEIKNNLRLKNNAYDLYRFDDLYESDKLVFKNHYVNIKSNFRILIDKIFTIII